MKKHPCPKCKSENIAEIVYGFVPMTDELQKTINQGKYVLGGCCITEDDPLWFCNDCRAEFGSRFHSVEDL